MLSRTLATKLRSLAGPYPVVFLTGPRQSGKTTLAQNACDNFEYLSLEDLQTRAEALEDPRGFLNRFKHGEGVVIDEAQRAPDLFSYLQGFVDDRRGGPFVLTGSQHFLLSEKINQSLAGRAAILELLPFSLAELTGVEARDPDRLSVQPSDSLIDLDLEQILFGGLFPRIHDRNLEPAQWLDGYVRTYVERDVRTLSGVGNLDLFTKFIGLCAGRTGQIFNASAVGGDVGVSHGTIKKWLSILRASYIVDLLTPHHNNFRKRLIKSPKLYFVDTGLLCHLLGIQNAGQLRTHPLRGAIFENFVFNEYQKIFTHYGKRPPLFFWRDSRGREVDLVIDNGGKLLPVEIKAGQTISRRFFEGLDYYTGLTGGPPGILAYGGDDSYDRLGHQVRSWKKLSVC